MSVLTKSPKKEPNHCTTNGHVQPDKQLRSVPDKLSVSKKVFVARNSLLTDLSQMDETRCLFNIPYAVTILIFFNMTIFYLMEPSKLWDDFSIMAWATSKFSYCLMFWLLFNLTAFAFYEGFKLWIAVRNIIYSKVTDKLFLLLYITFYIFTFVATAYYMLYEIGLPPICAMAATNEQLRIHMKIHSFVRESIPHVMQCNPHKERNQQLYPTRKHFLYFLFAPTFIYRDSYPRSEKRHWGNLFYNLYIFSLVLFFYYCVFVRFNIDLYKNAGLRPFTKKQIALIIPASVATGITFLLVLFYGIVHCWQNVFAELLRFGDREFYQDWWNSVTFSQYYRKWNLLVHDWLYTYIYAECQQLGCSSFVSTAFVFITSGIFHEYMIAATVGYFYPVLLMTYLFTISYIFLTRRKTSSYWNLFMWFNFLIGNGGVFALYTCEWYARVNCPMEKNQPNSFLSRPRSWDPSCQIFDFS